MSHRLSITLSEHAALMLQRRAKRARQSPERWAADVVSHALTLAELVDALAAMNVAVRVPELPERRKRKPPTVQ
jgi:isopentenyldiphosphate isomerase